MQSEPLPLPDAVRLVLGRLRRGLPGGHGQGALLLRPAPRGVAGRDRRGARQDAFCPHLGAHLGHGGAVEGCELRCPFHGWKFDAEGANTDIPYSDRVNRKAQLRTYPVAERNGFVLVWYHPDDKPPSWDVEEMPDLHTGEFTGPIRTHHVVNAGVQEMGENAVDSAHFRYVHNTATVPEIEPYEIDGHRSDHEVAAAVPDPSRAWSTAASTRWPTVRA